MDDKEDMWCKFQFAVNLQCDHGSFVFLVNAFIIYLKLSLSVHDPFYYRSFDRLGLGPCYAPSSSRLTLMNAFSIKGMRTVNIYYCTFQVFNMRYPEIHKVQGAKCAISN